jgi:hypothetical protein
MRAARREARSARIARAMEDIFRSSDESQADETDTSKKDTSVNKKRVKLASNVASRRPPRMAAGKSRKGRKMPTQSTIEWPSALHRRNAPITSDQNANIIFHDRPTTSSAVTPVEFTHASKFICSEYGPGSTQYNDAPVKPENVFPCQLYEAEIARQKHFSLAIGTLKRRLSPCCSQFYVPMVFLGKTPPFEGI